mgnify:FL=1|jgi:hypothetical protein
MSKVDQDKHGTYDEEANTYTKFKKRKKKKKQRKMKQSEYRRQSNKGNYEK